MHAFRHIINTIPEKLEIINFNASFKYLNSTHCFEQNMISSSNEQQEHSSFINSNYYDSLTSELLNNVHQMKTNSSVNIFNSSKLTVNSGHRISNIQILIRDDININVNLNSSNLAQLIGDVEFISLLPFEFIEYLDLMIGQTGYEEISDNVIAWLKNKPVVINLSIGSLQTEEIE